MPSRAKLFSFTAIVLGVAVVVVFFVMSGGNLDLLLGRGDRVFPRAAGVLAQFEFNGDAKDSSGSRRHARLLGGEFVPTAWGQGLAVRDTKLGIDWSAYAKLLRAPYTIEMVLTPVNTANYGKLFGASDGADEGWYYVDQGIIVYPQEGVAAGAARGGERHYIAFVSAGAERVEIFFQGVRCGIVTAGFSSPPSEAIFFTDDSRTGRGEQLEATVEALRISGVARSAEEIAAIQRRLESREDSR